MPFQTPITIATALERMHRHEYVLPAIQREFVWGADRICTLFDSLSVGTRWARCCSGRSTATPSVR
jgi:uncharacterized protein with ParB-like and HNH nuclease domain